MYIIIEKEGYAPYYSAPSWLKSNNDKLKDYGVWDLDNNRFSMYRLGVNVGSENSSD